MIPADVDSDPLVRPHYRQGVTYFCSVCRKDWKDADDLTKHWNRKHW